MAAHPTVRLSGEDLTFWWADSPMQPTTMAMLLVLDRAPERARLRHAFERAVAAVPRLRQRVVEAPLDLTLPHWEIDPTFDLDYHLRRHALGGTHDLRRALPRDRARLRDAFDRSRPLWEARLYEGSRDGRCGALLQAPSCGRRRRRGRTPSSPRMTDWEREPAERAGRSDPRAARRGRGRGARRSAGDSPTRSATASRSMSSALGHRPACSWTRCCTRRVSRRRSRRCAPSPRRSRFDSHSPLKRRDAFGRARRLVGMDLPFEEVRRIRHALEGTMIDVILTIMARAMGKWHRAHGMTEVARADDARSREPARARGVDAEGRRRQRRDGPPRAAADRARRTDRNVPRGAPPRGGEEGRSRSRRDAVPRRAARRARPAVRHLDGRGRRSARSTSS